MRKSAETTLAIEAENADLRARLEEAEQTLEAIRSGKVDALIVSGSEGERVFTLKGADHRYRRIVEGMTEGAAIVNPQGVILYANSAFSRLAAAPLDRVLGSQIRLYVPAEAAASFERLMTEASRPEARAEERMLLRSADRVVPVHVSAAADGESEHGGICLVITDLSAAMRDAERRRSQLSAQLENAIREKEAQRKLSDSLFMNAPAAITLLRGRDHVVEAANEGTFALWACTAEETIGKPLLDVVPSLRGQGFEEILDEVLRTGNPFVVNELPAKVSRGDAPDTVYVNIVCTPTHDAVGAVDGIAAFALDVTTQVDERKRTAAAQRRARAKAEEATRLKDEFLATLSHELRTPLNAILGWSRMLQSGAAPAEKRDRALEAIVRNAKAQNQLIEDLLDVSRIMSGKLRLSVDSVDLAQIVEAAIDVVQPAGDAKGVRIQKLLDPDAGPVSGDPGRLQQVVWNLLSNAVKFTPRGGRVHVTVRRAESNVEISVSDTGSGITQDFLPYVFDRFRQEDGAITRKAGGLGLGLAIVKNIVELHGGGVEAHSGGADQGSTFTVKIPVASVRAKAVSPPAEPPAPASVADPPWTCPVEITGLKVMVVDDEADARDLIRTVLEHCAAVVTTACSSAEALDRIPKVRPEVIVSDIGLPDEDGYAFIRKLRELPREAGGRTPAVALTAYARPEDRRRALLDGFQSHAVKPVDPQELVIVIANLVGRVS
jgi:PAS domain S-box-containing protein